MSAKYYDKINEYQKERQQQGEKPGLPDFDFQKLGASNAFGKFTGRLIEQLMPLLLWILRTFFPVVKLGGFYWITRKKDVRAALEKPEVLNVPYGLEMRELSRFDGKEGDFVLGLDGDRQKRQNDIIREIVLNGDIPRLATWSAEYSKALIAGGEGRLDVVTDLSIRVPTEICRRYFGLEFSDPSRFAEWAMAVSTLLFADPGGDLIKREQGIAGAARLTRVIDIALMRAFSDAQNFPLSNEQTLVQRIVMLMLKRTYPDLHLPEARAILLGLIVGFIPTNGLAASKMLEVLIGKRQAFGIARKAAVEGDVDVMKRIALEAGRLNPALAPGQWRYARCDYDLHGKKIPKGSTVMVSTMSSLHDTRAAFTFDPARPPETELIFGHATHKCIGQYLAIGVITPIFIELFKQKNLRRARGRFGRMQRVGFLPHRLDLEYDASNAMQTQIVACIPIEKRGDEKHVREMLDALKNPARPDVAQTLKDTGIVHFASASVVAVGEKENEGPFVVILEFNIDGRRDDGIKAIGNHCGKWLAPVLHAARPSDLRPVANVIEDYSLDLSFWPWGTTGLNFFGVGGLSVSEIDKQAALRDVAQREVSRYLRKHGQNDAGLRARAMLVLTAVRRELRNSEFGPFLVQPSRKKNEISAWRKPKNFWEPMAGVIRTKLVLGLLAAFALTWFLLGLLVHLTVNAPNPTAPAPEWVAELGRLGVSAIIGLLMAGLIWAAVVWGLWSAFLRAERKEPVDERMAEPAKLQEIVRRENNSEHLQNHIIAVTPLKKGLLRRFALALGLWGIRQSLRWFRPGFVVTMGTIHFAKWFRMPGSRKLIFQSNYDGSWESYLEDFVTRAHQGQTAAWSNGEGFPRSQGLINGGARDGDRFKRWVRRQQIPTSFWYSRFPKLTAIEQRTNSLVHEGLANARSDSAARSWLDLLGSAQRQPHELESTEIQSLVFRGLKNARVSAFIPIRLPETRKAVGDWLEDVMPQISFGKFPDRDKAQYLAFSAEGLRKIGKLGDVYRDPIDLLADFPGAFSSGMGARSAILGDPNDSRLWTDAASSGPDCKVDAMLFVYAPDAAGLHLAVNQHREFLARHGGGVLHQIIRTVHINEEGKIADLNLKASYEHFGFRDGISSPVIRGAEQFLPDAADRDVVEAGEIILGYQNNQHYFAPPIVVPASSDTGENLPLAPDRITFGFADFDGADGLFADRDFGRNGAFVAVRQLAQDVEGFRKFTEQVASNLNAEYSPDRLRDAVGCDVDGTWVAAKMMGRWQNGLPLIGNPRPYHPAPKPDNSFLFGQDDPRGHGCPLGAHIRRANPRDTLEPGDPLEQAISRRHQILRRGRTYFYDKASGEYPVEAIPAEAERGLMFVALCADLERQFELIMQTWLGFPSFHGLAGEPDPISTLSSAPDERTFTIPTAAGPLVVRNMQSFVSLRAGGYFFLPSRSALNYLRSLSRLPESGLPMLSATM